MARLYDWPERLNATIKAAMGRKFEYGKHDCLTFANECYVAVTGRDPKAPLTYKTMRGAARVLRKWSKDDDLVECATKLLGPPLKSPLLAQRGDLVVMKSNTEGIAACNFAIA